MSVQDSHKLGCFCFCFVFYKHQKTIDKPNSRKKTRFEVSMPGSDGFWYWCSRNTDWMQVQRRINNLTFLWHVHNAVLLVPLALHRICHWKQSMWLMSVLAAAMNSDYSQYVALWHCLREGTFYKHIKPPPVCKVGSQEATDHDVDTPFCCTAVFCVHALIGFGEQPKMAACQNVFKYPLQHQQHTNHCFVPKHDAPIGTKTG